MQSTKYLKTLSLGILITVAVGCVYDPHYYGPPPHPRPAYYYPWGYYYYPSVQVYFHYATGFYYYPSGKVWIRSRVLPPRFRLDARDRVHLEIRSDKPYLYHHDQLKRYQPPKEHRALPGYDHKERETLRKWHKEQQVYKQKKQYGDHPGEKDKDKKRR